MDDLVYKYACLQYADMFFSLILEAQMENTESNEEKANWTENAFSVWCTYAHTPYIRRYVCEMWPCPMHTHLERRVSMERHQPSSFTWQNTVALVARQTDLFPHIHNRLLSAPSSSVLPGCLPAPGKHGTFIYSIQTEKAQSEKKRKIILVFVPLCTEH